MYKSLNKLKKLPHDTKIFCGHEYTKQNSKFCLTYDANNKNLKTKINEIDLKLKKISKILDKKFKLKFLSERVFIIEKK